MYLSIPAELPPVSLMLGDCLERMEEIPDGSVDMVLADPPYNIGVTSMVDGKLTRNDWDRIADYEDWFLLWVSVCARKLKPNGVLYFWHSDMEQLAELLVRIKRETPLVLVSFCIWDKGNTYRSLSWKDRSPDDATALRSWFSVCEYCVHFFNTPGGARSADKTGLDRINSNPECYKPLKEWYASELERLGLSEMDIAAEYTRVTGRKPYMLRHYFHDSQFEIPTQEIWDAVYAPLGFNREYEELRREYEELRREYEELRNYHRSDARHCNIWHVPPVPSTGRLHTCQKPVPILERICRVSCPEGGIVLDPFMGSGSTGVACVNTGRAFIGIERDPGYFAIAQKRIAEAQERVTNERAQIKLWEDE